jgi:Mrp family chromosome partitioning ATPase
MTEMNRQKVQPSLLERAAEVYDFASFTRKDGARPIEREPRIAPPAESTEPAADAVVTPPVAAPRTKLGRVARIDRDLLAERNLLVPGAPVGALAEEFRLVKRQLLVTAATIRATDPDRARTILVCSAQPAEGKTYCAVNLALSMAAEREMEILLVDGDFPKPDAMARLGLEEGPGLLDALADPRLDVEDFVVPTDVPQLSVLPAGTKTIGDTELLASGRTPQVIERLLAADPRRMIIFDSPPALAASPASVFAMYVGQVMMVVRADRTTEGDLREGVGQLARCPHIQLLLNSVTLNPGRRRFGTYYVQEDGK